MEAPDKIYIPVNPFNDGGTEDFCVNHKTFDTDIEYIRKDALLEWLQKELESAELTNFDEFGRGEVITWGHILDKLNSM